MWLDGKDIKLVMANGHCSTPFQRLCCSDMHTCILETPLPWRVWASLCSWCISCIAFAFGWLVLMPTFSSLSFQWLNFLVSVYSCSANVMIGLLFLCCW
jgi:hypothetical protein